MRPRLLDLFCGAGGAAMGYHRAGFEVVGVDVKAQPRYPFDFVQANALDYLACGTAHRASAIHASPPCQGYSRLGSGQPRLIGATRGLLCEAGLPYVIENIPDAAHVMLEPVLLCGSMFDPVLIDRHRYFEANWPLRPPIWPCRHKLAEPAFPVYEHGQQRLRRWPAVYGHGGGKSFEAAPDAMGIDWMTRAELVEAIPPRFTEFIGRQLKAQL